MPASITVSEISLLMLWLKVTWQWCQGRIGLWVTSINVTTTVSLMTTQYGGQSFLNYKRTLESYQRRLERSSLMMPSVWPGYMFAHVLYTTTAWSQWLVFSQVLACWNFNYITMFSQVSAFTHSVLVLRLSWKWIGKGVNSLIFSNLALNWLFGFTRSEHCVKPGVTTVFTSHWPIRSKICKF